MMGRRGWRSGEHFVKQLPPELGLAVEGGIALIVSCGQGLPGLPAVPTSTDSALTAPQVVPHGSNHIDEYCALHGISAVLPLVTCLIPLYGLENVFREAALAKAT